MKMSSSQTQKSGNDSINIQAESITFGLTYSDVKQIASDVFKNNFIQMSTIAADIAQRRAEEITEKFLHKLQNRNPKALNSTHDPDFQYSLFTIQKEYAKSGDKNMGDLLVDILVERTKVEQRGLLQIVLNESLAVVPKLTIPQLNALSIIFSLKYAKYGIMNSLDMLKHYLSHCLTPFVTDLPKSQASYQHLEYAGCGSIPTGILSGPVVIPNIFKSKYPGVFTKGFTKEQFENNIGQIIGSEKLIIKCLRNNELLQFNVIDHETLKKATHEIGINDEDHTKIKNFWNQYIMDDEEIKNDLIHHNKNMSMLFEVWDNSPIQHIIAFPDLLNNISTMPKPSFAVIFCNRIQSC
jgi:hypothetical protein